MRLIGLAVIFTLGLTLVPLAAEPQQVKVYRVRVLFSGSPPAPGSQPGIFMRALRDVGYIEGRNIVFDRRWAEGKTERFSSLATELVALKPDAIVAVTTAGVIAAKRATTTIPIVMFEASDPVALGLVTTLARPGGNVTGLAILTAELVGKQLQLLMQVIPKASRIAFLTNPSNPGSALQLREAETAARSLGVQLQVLETRRPDELDRAFAAMTRELAGAVLVPGDPGFFLYRTQISDLAIKSRLPAMFAQREHAEAGGLMVYGPPLRDNFRRAATYVDKILTARAA